MSLTTGHFVSNKGQLSQYPWSFRAKHYMGKMINEFPFWNDSCILSQQIERLGTELHAKFVAVALRLVY